MLETCTILPHTLELLKRLSQESALSGTRLVGGTALALQYGHRSSVYLDFFGHIEDDNAGLQRMLSNLGKYTVISEAKNIKCYVLDGIKLDIVNYNYPWIDEPLIVEGLVLASPKDIAAMKINAIEGRGSKKDFIDIYFLLQHYTLKELMGFYAEKYPEHSEFRALMSLSYFVDADQQASPKMFSKVSWEEMKDHIIKQVNDYR